MIPQTWFVQLRGHQFDLAHLASHLAQPAITVRADEPEGNYVLCSEQFQGATSSEAVLERAGDLAAILNGVLRVARGTTGTVSLGAVYRINDKGGRDVFVHIVDGVTVRAECGILSATVTDKDGKIIPTPPPPPSRTKLLTGLALNDAIVARALRLHASPDAGTWVGLYRLYEVIEAELGDQARLVATGWASRPDIRRFKHSANSIAVAGDGARHGKETEAPPKHPMTLDEGIAFVGYVLQAWLASKGA
jgi:hypothetical protein